MNNKIQNKPQNKPQIRVSNVTQNPNNMKGNQKLDIGTKVNIPPPTGSYGKPNRKGTVAGHYNSGFTHVQVDNGIIEKFRNANVKKAQQSRVLGKNEINNNIPLSPNELKERKRSQIQENEELAKNLNAIQTRILRPKAKYPYEINNNIPLSQFELEKIQRQLEKIQEILKKINIKNERIITKK